MTEEDVSFLWNWWWREGCAPFWMFWNPTSGPVGGAIAAGVVSLLVAGGLLWAIL